MKNATVESEWPRMAPAVRLTGLAGCVYYPSCSSGRAGVIKVKADDLREETQRLASIYQRKLAALAALKKSLLHQAFCGEL